MLAMFPRWFVICGNQSDAIAKLNEGNVWVVYRGRFAAANSSVRVKTVEVMGSRTENANVAYEIKWGRVYVRW